MTFLTTNAIVLIILSVLAMMNLLLYIFIPAFRGKAAVISRTFIGMVFIFSGFVKGVDPMGFMYKIEDYFIAYSTPWMNFSAIYLAMFFCALEFMLGVTMLLNIKTKHILWLVVLTMGGFTVLTFIDAVANPVPDCGCFGEAIKFTNVETFWKNVVIDLFLLIIILYRKKFRPAFSRRAELLVITTVSVVFLAFEVYNYRHLPLIDFMEWKAGNKMFIENPQPLKYYLTYKNKETGEEKEYLSPDYPYNDSVWMSKWEFVDTRVEDPNPKVTGLLIADSTGNDLTEHIIKNPGHQFILVINNIRKTDRPALKRINAMVPLMESGGASIVGLTSGSGSEISRFITEMKSPYELYNSDDVILKTMVRSNPGLLLLKNGVVLRKWHCNDFPDAEEIKEILKK